MDIASSTSAAFAAARSIENSNSIQGYALKQAAKAEESVVQLLEQAKATPPDHRGQNVDVIA